MKKVYLMVSGLLLVAGAANAQVAAENAYQTIEKSDGSSRVIGLYSADRAPGDVLYSDDFSSDADWSFYTEGGTVPAWEYVTTTPTDLVDYMDVFASPTNANGFAAFNGVQYLLTGTVEPIDAIVEYDVTLDFTGAPALSMSFFSAYRAFNTDDVYVEFSIDGGPWGSAVQIQPDLATNAATVQETVILDISGIAGGESDVRIRFRYQELGADASFGAGYGWMIDDFQISEAWDYDLATERAYHRSGVGGDVFTTGLDYYFIPPSQVAPIEFSGIGTNLGGIPAPNGKLNVDVSGAGTFSDNSTPADIAVGTTDSLFLTTTFTPSALGDYTVEFYCDSDGGEQETSNDTITRVITATDAIYARHDGNSTSSIGNVTSNVGAPLVIGNIMEIFGGDVTVGSMNIAVTADDENVDQLIYGQIMRYDAAADAYIYVDQTADHTITAGENGGFITLFFDEPIDLDAGDDLLVLAGHYGGADEVRFRLAQTVETGTVLGYTSGSTDAFQLLDPGAVFVELVITEGASINEEVSNNFSIGQNMPNPFSETSVINYELEEAANVSVDFYDVTGKIVNTVNNGEQQAGAYTINVNANDFAEGVYYYTFTIGAEKVTKRMVITK